jgi:beta-galactosidase
MNNKINIGNKIFLGILLFSINCLNAQTINDWENPDVNGINKEQPHAFGFCPTKRQTTQ